MCSSSSSSSLLFILVGKGKGSGDPSFKGALEGAGEEAGGGVKDVDRDVYL